jgi:hypothetical protein
LETVSVLLDFPEDVIAVVRELQSAPRFASINSQRRLEKVLVRMVGRKVGLGTGRRVIVFKKMWAYTCSTPQPLDVPTGCHEQQSVTPLYTFTTAFLI